MNFGYLGKRISLYHNEIITLLENSVVVKRIVKKQVGISNKRNWLSIKDIEGPDQREAARQKILEWLKNETDFPPTIDGELLIKKMAYVDCMICISVYIHEYFLNTLKNSMISL